MTQRLLRSGAVVITLLGWVAVLAGLFAERFIAERTGPTILLTYAPQAPWLLVPAAGFLASAAARRPRLVLANAVLAVVVTFGLLGFNIPHRAPSDTPDLTVVTWNIRGRLADVDAIARHLAAFNADVIVLQEASDISLDGHLPEYRQASGGDILILSRLPMESHGEVILGDHRFRNGLWVSISCKGRPIDVLGVHLSVLATEGSLRPRQSLGPRRAYLHQTAAARQAQAEGILRWARTRDNPIIIAGDFNTPPNSMVYRRLRTQVDDAFATAGWGRGLTYSTRRPLWRIDYIFSRRLIARSAQVIEAAASDHKPVRSGLSLDAGRP